MTGWAITPGQGEQQLHHSSWDEWEITIDGMRRFGACFRVGRMEGELSNPID
jgi:hypothetical protein